MRKLIKQILRARLLGDAIRAHHLRKINQEIHSAVAMPIQSSIVRPYLSCCAVNKI
ncbi:hypothetical protein EBME_0903 [bacterium endosymbiont of Mortierella elongata FMR23-6]|nr:hypothetical protein EBME_0903 [bacterium endosymbiont of Mortierella elongata FMR23-6]